MFANPIADRTRVGRWSAIVLVGPAMLSLLACTTLDLPIDPVEPARVSRILSATGVQIYECRSEAGKPAPVWAFVAPDAELFDGSGRSVGTHGAGPSWNGVDGSRVIGSVRARMDAPTAQAIPWLLLSTRSVGADGAFSAVTQIQRLRTDGGVAPASGCDATRLGQRARVRYRAEYRFFVAA